MQKNRRMLPYIGTNADYMKIVIGNSIFTDDIWDLTSFMEVKTTYDCNKKISFYYIQEEEMKHIVKLYAYYKLGKVKPQTVKSYVNDVLPKFFERNSFVFRINKGTDV